MSERVHQGCGNKISLIESESGNWRPGVHLVGLKAEVRVEDEARGQVVVLAQFLSRHARRRDVPSFRLRRTTVET